MPDQIPHAVKQRRFDGLINMQKRISLAANLPYEGQTFEVLVEGPSKKNSDKLTGRTRTNKIVNFSGDDALIGTLVPVHITHAGLYALDGELAAVATLPPVLIA
jgi:tRNA-2-methylthio-N6-dimethylallyladenosine synthase